MAVLYLRPIAASFLGILDGGLVCVVLGVATLAFFFYINWVLPRQANPSSSAPLVSPNDAVSSPVAFDPIRDARGPVTIFGLPVVFSSKLEAEKYPNIVTGLTLNRDYVAVRRGAYGVKAFLLNEALTLGLLPGCPPGFYENSDYTLELESETEVARFPVSFQGWLQIVDAARRGGATIEVDAGLPGHLKDLIETPLPGDESIKPLRTKAACPKKEAAREAGRCGSCGATIGRKTSCDYCGAAQ